MIPEGRNKEKCLAQKQHKRNENLRQKIREFTCIEVK